MAGTPERAVALGRIVAAEFRRRLLDEQLPRITRCARMLGEPGIWARPAPNCNSVGNLLLHLIGNTTQWILVPFTGIDDERQRDREFAADGGIALDELLQQFAATYHAAVDAVAGLGVDDLMRPLSIQGYDETGLSAVLHVLEHSSGHAGQIYAWTKQVTGKDLKFYDL
jgi:uncharacterized damage-inducible protein DinB